MLKQKILKTFIVLIGVILTIIILLALNLYITLDSNTRNPQKVELGQGVYIDAPFYFPDRIRTNSTIWEEDIHTEASQFEKQVFSPEKSFTQKKFTNSEETIVPLSFRIMKDFEINIGEIKVDTETNSPEIKTNIVDKDSILIEIKGGSQYAFYTIQVDEKSYNCDRSSAALVECKYKFAPSSKERFYIPHSITISPYTVDFTMDTIYKSLVIQTPDKSVEIIYDSTKPDVFCAGKSSCILGSAVSGTPIEARVYGSGTNRLFLFGAIHGSEQNSTDLMNQVIGAIDSNQITIPTDKQVIIIPALNLDGYLSDERLNLNSVDLNRNFPTADWQADTYLTDGQTFKNGGGTKPLSEPETQLLLHFIETVNPYLAISYHSWGGYVMPNHGANALTIGRKYARLSKYVYSDPDEDNEGFNYTVTGTIETWGEEHGYSVMSIELHDLVNHDIDNNKAAIQMAIDWK